MSAFFTKADIAALGGSWSWLAGVAGQAMQQGSEGLLEDTLASVQPWGFQPDAIRVPVLIMHGAKDKMVPCAHGEWLAARCPAAESRIVPDAGHITVLDSAPEALTWLAARVADAAALREVGAVPSGTWPYGRPERPQCLAELLREQLRLGDGGEVAAPVVLGPGGDREVPFGELAWEAWGTGRSRRRRCRWRSARARGRRPAGRPPERAGRPSTAAARTRLSWSPSTR